MGIFNLSPSRPADPPPSDGEADTSEPRSSKSERTAGAKVALGVAIWVASAAVGLAIFVAQLAWLIAISIVAMGLANPSGEGWLNTDNVFAWVVVLFVLILGGKLVSAVVGLLNDVAAFAGGWTISALWSLAVHRGKDGPSIEFIAVSGRILVVLIWAVGAGFLASMAVAFFVANPQLNGWLAGGGWLVWLLAYVAILGLALPDLGRGD